MKRFLVTMFFLAATITAGVLIYLYTKKNEENEITSMDGENDHTTLKNEPINEKNEPVTSP